MAATVSAAVADRLESFTYPAAVPVFLDEAPARTAPPYLVVKTDDARPGYTLEYVLANEVVPFRVEVYALTRESLDEIVEVVKYNGNAVGAGAGLDFGDLTVAGQTCEAVIRDGDHPFQDQDRYDADALVFRNTMRYRAAMLRT